MEYIAKCDRCGRDVIFNKGENEIYEMALELGVEFWCDLCVDESEEE